MFISYNLIPSHEFQPGPNPFWKSGVIHAEGHPFFRHLERLQLRQLERYGFRLGQKLTVYVDEPAETHVPVHGHVRFGPLRTPFVVPFLKLFGHETRRRPVSSVVEATGHGLMDVVPVEECYDLLQSVGPYGQGTIYKQVRSYRRWPDVDCTQVFFDDFEQVHETVGGGKEKKEKNRHSK